MRLLLTIAAMFLASSLTGCGTFTQLSADKLESVSEARGHVVEALTGASAPATGVSGVIVTGRQMAYDMVQDSQSKCADFVTVLFSRSGSTNVALDVAQTIFSAAGTAFTPINTVHTLTALGTVAGGSKTAISVEFLNSVTISHIAQAIQSTYSKDISTYIGYLDSLPNTTAVDAIAERSKILSYHNECSLPAADGSISTALQPPTTKTASSTTLKLQYTVDATDIDAPTLAKNLAKAVNANSDFQATKITAYANNDTVVFTVPAGLELQQNNFVGVSGAKPTEAAVTYKTTPSNSFQITGTMTAGDSLIVEFDAAATQTAAIAPAAPAAPPIAAAPAAQPAPATPPVRTMRRQAPPEAAILGRAPGG